MYQFNNLTINRKETKNHQPTTINRQPIINPLKS